MFNKTTQFKRLSLLAQVLSLLFAHLANGQLPDDIQRELNQNLAEQARIQAMRQQHQKQIQSRTGANQKAAPPAPHDPNNYSYQQVSPPIQYSYYQPFGDAAQQPQGAQPQSSAKATPAAAAAPVNFDFNNLNFDLPQPQAQVSAASAGPSSRTQQHLTPSFTGAAGLPIMKPIANQAAVGDAYAPPGNAPLAPQARVQQGPPLTEADFKDITGGENYGAPGGDDFGLGAASGSGNRAPAADNTDAQLREFGMPAEQQQLSSAGRRSGNADLGQMNIPDFGGFNPIGAGSGNRRAAPTNDDDFGGFNPMAAGSGSRRAAPNDDFGNLGGLAGDSGQPQNVGNSPQDFDFAGQPSSNRGDQTAASGGAPGSLQSLLGASFPGLGGNGGGNSGLDEFARGNNDPQQQVSAPSQQRLDDGSLDIADMGDKSDQFSGANLGGFEQPSPQGDQDFNMAAAAQQPVTVPYPDGAPQPVGTLWALTQPQSLTQTRYNALLDKGTYQDYPAYLQGGPPTSVKLIRQYGVDGIGKVSSVSLIYELRNKYTVARRKA